MGEDQRLQVENLLRRLVGEGVFGQHLALSQVEGNDDGKKREGYASRVDFFKLHFKGADCPLSIVVKRPHAQDILRETFNNDDQFNNEVTMLKDVLPRLGEEVWRRFPKMYFGNTSRGPKDVVVMEDLRVKGFCTAKDVLHLDHSHCLLAIRKLGEFHGMMFQYKSANREEFFKLADRLFQHRLHYPEDNEYWSMVKASMLRGINPLIKTGFEVETLKKLVEALENTKKLTGHLINPEDPFDLIIHGDFNRNNMMFKYDSTNTPVDVIFLDLQDSSLSNIVVDLSFFLYMHTSASSRGEYWDFYLKEYFSSFSEACEYSGPSFEEFLEYFSKKALYGFLPTSFFAPVMLMISRGENYSVVDSSGEVNLLTTNNTPLIGGEDGTELLKDIVLHLLDKKYIQSFLATL